MNSIGFSLKTLKITVSASLGFLSRGDQFWRTRNGEEVDFIFIKDQEPYLFEVKSKLNKPEITEGIKKFIRAYSNTQRVFIINETLNEIIKYENTQIEFITIQSLELNKNVRAVFEN